MGDRDRADEIQDVVAAEKLRLDARRFAVGPARRERHEGIFGHLFGAPVVLVQPVVEVFPFEAVTADRGVVAVEEHHAARLRGLGELELGAAHVFERLEGLEVLFAHGGDDGVKRMDEVADLLDLAHPAGAHFADEDLVRKRDVAAHELHDPHRRVAAAGRHEDVVLDPQKRREEILHAGLAVAPRDADDDEVGIPT